MLVDRYCKRSCQQYISSCKSHFGPAGADSSAAPSAKHRFVLGKMGAIKSVSRIQQGREPAPTAAFQGVADGWVVRNSSAVGERGVPMGRG